MVIHPKGLFALSDRRELLATTGPGEALSHWHVEGDANLFEIRIDIGCAIFRNQPDDHWPAGLTLELVAGAYRGEIKSRRLRRHALGALETVVTD